MIVVPDASVILKWVLPQGEEPNWEQARRILELFVDGDLQLAVPPLWYYEAGNTLERRFGDEPAAEMLRWLLELDLPEVSPRSGWGRTAVSLVAAAGVTFYDAAYHAVAVHVGGVLVTADSAFVRRVRAYGSIVPLERFEPEA